MKRKVYSGASLRPITIEIGGDGQPDDRVVKSAIPGHAHQNSLPTRRPSDPRRVSKARAYISRLEDELERAQTQLRLSAAERRLRSASTARAREEMLSINADLRTSTSELEASKDTLRLVNERLLAQNRELERKIEDLMGVNSGLQMLIDNTPSERRDERLETIVETLEVLLAERAEQVKQLTSELILSEQIERRRVAQVLHDDLQQLLYAFQIRVGTLVPDLSPELAERLAQANSLIARALDVTRTLTVELSPPALEGVDLSGTLEWLALRIEEVHDLKVTIDSAGTIHLPAELRTLVYHLVRELLFNVVKHASVDRANVHVNLATDQLIVSVEDEGVGFDPAAEHTSPNSANGGFGMRSVRQRLAYLGGHLEQASELGKGSRVTFFLPLVPPPAAAG